MRKIYKIVPDSKLFDVIISTIRFIRRHRRIPRKRNFFNDRLFYLKISTEIDKPLRKSISDKEYVKEYIKEKIGEQYVVETLFVIRDSKELITKEFPEDCVAKSTHASGQIIFSPTPLSYPEMEKWLEFDYYKDSRERNYRDLEKKIIVESKINLSKKYGDLKVFCVNGNPKLVQVGLWSPSADNREYYSLEWDLVLKINRTKAKKIDPPNGLNEIIAVSRVLAAEIGDVRVDFLIEESGEKKYVGELTNCHWGAHDRFGGVENEMVLSKYLFE